MMLAWVQAALFVVQLVIIAAGVVLSAKARKKGRTDGYAADPENPQDPEEPIRAPYGAPLRPPPLVTRYPIPQALNSLKIARTAEVVAAYHCGYGTQDGGGFKVYLDGRPLQSTITSDDPSSKRTLFPVGGDRRKWAFPVNGVLPDTVSIFVDGVLYASNARGLGVTTEAVVEEEMTVVPVFFRDPKPFTPLVGIALDATAPGDAVGGVLPDSVLKGLDVYTYLLPNTPKRTKVDPGIVRYGETSDAALFGKPTKPVERAFWYRPGSAAVAASFFGSGAWNGGGSTKAPKVTFNSSSRFIVVIRHHAKLPVVVDADGSAYVLFPEDVADGAVVTWLGDTSLVDPEQLVPPRFYRGAPDDGPIDLPFYSGFPRTFSVGAELEPATSVVHEGRNECDDVVIELQAPGGLYRQGSSGIGGTSVELAIRVRENGAPDENAAGSDPATGWVTLKHPNGIFYLDGGKQQSPGSWHFSIGSLLKFTRDGQRDLSTGLAGALKRGKYDVEVRRVTPAGSDSTVDAVEFAQVTEVNYVSVEFPGQAVMVLHFKDAGLVTRNPLVEIENRAMEVEVPASAASVAVREADGWHLRPSVLRWSRNPVWCACDYIAHNGYNGGKRRDGRWNVSHVDMASAWAAAAKCDRTEDYGTRAELDIDLNERRTLYEDVSAMLTGSGVQFVQRDGKWFAEIDEPAAPVDTIAADDVEGGEVRLVPAHIASIPTVLEVVHPDEMHRYERKSVPLVPEGLVAEQRVVSRVEMPGVRRRAQAVFFGSLALRQARAWTRAVEMIGAGWRLLARKTGQRVRLTFPDLGLDDAVFRISAGEIDSDLRFRLECSEADPSVYGTASGIVVAGATVPGLKPGPATASGKAQDVAKADGKAQEAAASGATSAGTASAVAILTGYQIATPSFTVTKK
ncbi:MAG: phage tail protein [Planctomycetota bacterium]